MEIQTTTPYHIGWLHLAVVAAIIEMDWHAAKRARREYEQTEKRRVKQWNEGSSSNFITRISFVSIHRRTFSHFSTFSTLASLVSAWKSILKTTNVRIYEAFESSLAGFFLHSQWIFSLLSHSISHPHTISHISFSAHIKLLHNYVVVVAHMQIFRQISTEFSISQNENSSLF